MLTVAMGVKRMLMPHVLLGLTRLVLTMEMFVLLDQRVTPTLLGNLAQMLLLLGRLVNGSRGRYGYREDSWRMKIIFPAVGGSVCRTGVLDMLVAHSAPVRAVSVLDVRMMMVMVVMMMIVVETGLLNGR